MKQIVSNKDIQKLGIILSVWAHPDDETLSCAGIMWQAVQNGQQVVCLSATKGEAGSQDESQWPVDKIAEIRSKELADALRVIGVTNHHWLGYKDGACAEVDENEAASKIRKYIQLYQPDTILTFGSEGLTGHSDHKTVSAWVDKALQNSGVSAKIYHAVITRSQHDTYLLEADKKLNIFFAIDDPPVHQDTACDILYTCNNQASEVKRLAIESMPSQTKVMIDTFGRDFIANAFSVEAFKRHRSTSTI